MGDSAVKAVNPPQNAETARQLRSRLERILNVRLRVRLRCVRRLRSCWTNCLSILSGCPPLLSKRGEALSKNTAFDRETEGRVRYSLSTRR